VRAWLQQARLRFSVRRRHPSATLRF
jgi:hypothetical protein